VGLKKRTRSRQNVATVVTLTQPQLTVDLQAPPDRRWQLDSKQATAARALLHAYQRDLGLSPDAEAMLVEAADAFVAADLRAEHDGLAAQLGVHLPSNP
jgi:hypothetical protein